MRRRPNRNEMIKLLCAHIMFLIIDNKINCQYFSAKYRFLWIINAFAAWHTDRKNCFPLIHIFVTVRCGFGRSDVDRSLVVLFWWFFICWFSLERSHINTRACIVHQLCSRVPNDVEQAIFVESDIIYWVLIYIRLFKEEKTKVSIETFSLNSSSCTCWLRCFFFPQQASSLIHYAVESSTSFLNFINKYHVRSLLVHVLIYIIHTLRGDEKIIFIFSHFDQNHLLESHAAFPNQ